MWTRRSARKATGGLFSRSFNDPIGRDASFMAGGVAHNVLAHTRHLMPRSELFRRMGLCLAGRVDAFVSSFLAFSQGVSSL